MADNEERSTDTSQEIDRIAQEIAAAQKRSDAIEDIGTHIDLEESAAPVIEPIPEPKKKKSKKAVWILLVIIVLAAVCTLVTIHQNNRLQKSFYQVKSSNVTDNVRIVALADMHLKEFGENNERLVYEVSKLSPDIIALVGDMMIEDQPENYDCVITLCKELEEIAPVYYSLGNHEIDSMLFQGCQIYKDCKKEGIRIMNNETEQITVGGTTIDIIGLTQNPTEYEEYGKEFLENALAADDNFKLLLTHYPEHFIEDTGTLIDYDIDLAIAGHAHGGQVRLPWIGGLYAADQGFLPKLCDGYHEIGYSKLLITRGLGKSGIIPRINNTPEILVADISWY